MATSIPRGPHRGSGRFQQATNAFLAREGLPFAEILSAARMERVRVFARHGSLFRQHGSQSEP